MPISRWSSGSKSKLGPLAHLAHDDGVLLGHPVGRVGVGQVRERGGDPLDLGVDLVQLGFPGLDLLLQAPDRRDQLGSASSPRCFSSPICLESVLRSAWAPSISRQQLAPARVEGEQLVDVVGGAAARQRLP